MKLPFTACGSKADQLCTALTSSTWRAVSEVSVSPATWQSIYEFSSTRAGVRLHPEKPNPRARATLILPVGGRFVGIVAKDGLSDEEAEFA